MVVFDHSFSSPLFTWSNKQGDGFLAKKLDRVFINDKWHLSFAHSIVEFLPPRDSDHCLTVFQLSQ